MSPGMLAPPPQQTLFCYPHLGAPVLLSFCLIGGTAAGCFIYSPFRASLTPHPAGTDGRLVRFASLFVRRARRPS